MGLHIANGEMDKGCKYKDCEEWRDIVFQILNNIKVAKKAE